MQSAHKKIFSALFLALFITVTGVGIVVPLLPVYANNLGAGGIYIGLIFGAFSLSRTLFLPYFGRQSDVKGRKPYILVGLFSYALVSIAFTLASGVEALIVIRLFQGIASAMIMPVIQAYVGDITPPGHEGFTMGLFSVSVFLGLSVGPVAGGLINDTFSLKAAFLCMGGLSLVGFGVSLRLLPPRGMEKAIHHPAPPVPWSRILVDVEVRGLFIYRFAYTACIGVIWGFLPVYADTRFASSSLDIGILVVLGVFVSGAIHMPMGYLADRISRRAMVVVGGAMVVAAMVMLFRAQGYWDMIYASLVFGLGGGISMPALMALGVVKGNSTKAMGSIMSLLTMGHSLGMLAGSLLGGVMMDTYGLRMAFPVGGALMMAGTLCFFLCTHPKPVITPAGPPPPPADI